MVDAVRCVVPARAGFIARGRVLFAQTRQTGLRAEMPRARRRARAHPRDRRRSVPDHGSRAAAEPPHARPDARYRCAPRGVAGVLGRGWARGRGERAPRLHDEIAHGPSVAPREKRNPLFRKDTPMHSTIDDDDALTDAAPKPWYASTGVWGGLLTLAGSVLSLMKVQLDPQLLDDIRQWVLSLVTLVGGGVALWGRIRATRRIGKPSRATALLALISLGTCGLALSSSGCGTTLEGAYAQADRATYDAVAPEYAAYVAGDAKLTSEQRERRNRTVEMWRLRVEDEERRGVAQTTESAR
jgi:hypothetical protein